MLIYFVKSRCIFTLPNETFMERHIQVTTSMIVVIMSEEGQENGNDRTFCKIPGNSENLQAILGIISVNNFYPQWLAFWMLEIHTTQLPFSSSIKGMARLFCKWMKIEEAKAQEGENKDDKNKHDEDDNKED